MRLVTLIITGLWSYLFILSGIYQYYGNSFYFDGFTYLCAVFLVMWLSSLLMASNNISRPLIIVLSFYTFFMYLLGPLKLLLLSQFQDAWMFDNYSWATHEEVNYWLIYSTLSTVMMGTGMISGTIILKTNRRFGVEKDAFYDVSNLTVYSLFIVFVMFALNSYLQLSQFGYGSMSGMESNALGNLYGVIDLQSLVMIAMIMYVYQIDRLTKVRRFILLFIIFCYAIFQVSSGSRSALYYLLLSYLYFVAVFKGNYYISKRKLLIIVFIVAFSILLYPIGKSIKETIKYQFSASNPIGFVGILSGLSIRDVLLDFKSNSIDSGLEIVDRLSDMGAQLRIINDYSVVPAEEHINLINVLKRTVNEMIPGDFFIDVLPAQHVYYVVYQGFTPPYGGEILSLYGVFSVLFGHVGGLCGLFLIGVLLGICWKTLYCKNTGYRAVCLGTFILLLEWLFINTLMEGWFAKCFRVSLTILLVFVLIMFIKVPLKVASNVFQITRSSFAVRSSTFL